MNTLLQDIRYGIRMLLKHKGFTAVAIIALGLGIGANTAIFSLVNGVLLRPLPFPDAGTDRLLRRQKSDARHHGQQHLIPRTLPIGRNKPICSPARAAFWTGNANLGADGAEPERVPRAGVTIGFFSVLGVQPVLGRTFVPEDDKPETITVAIISHGLWKRRFGSDPGIVGKQVQISARPITVIGVMPPGFEFPEQTQIWVPSAVKISDEPRDNRSWSAIARLNAGVDLKQAQISHQRDQRAAREAISRDEQRLGCEPCDSPRTARSRGEAVAPRTARRGRVRVA